MAILKIDPAPHAISDDDGNRVKITTSVPTTGDRGITVYPVPSSAVTPVQGASEGVTGAPVPADATLVGGKDGSGNLKALKVDSADALQTSNIGLASMRLTKSVSLTSQLRLSRPIHHVQQSL